MDKKILLIVEGDDDEVKFLRGVFNKCMKKLNIKSILIEQLFMF